MSEKSKKPEFKTDWQKIYRDNIADGPIAAIGQTLINRDVEQRKQERLICK